MNAERILHPVRVFKQERKEKQERQKVQDAKDREYQDWKRSYDIAVGLKLFQQFCSTPRSRED
jgi:hypothetical protein